MQNEQVQSIDSFEKEERRFPIVWVAGGVLVAVLLAGGAFMAGRLLTPAADEPTITVGGNQFVIGTDGPGGEQFVTMQMNPAEELPKREPDVQGLFQSRNDNTLMVGTGNIEMMVTVDGDSAPEASASFDGPVLEVVVTGESVIYEDTTEMLTPDDIGENSGQEITIQQTLNEVGTVDDIEEDAEISVWGTRSGDRVIADTIVYRNFNR